MITDATTLWADLRVGNEIVKNLEPRLMRCKWLIKFRCHRFYQRQATPRNLKFNLQLKFYRLRDNNYLWEIVMLVMITNVKKYPV